MLNRAEKKRMFRSLLRLTKRPQTTKTCSSHFEQANQLAAQGKKKEAIEALHKVLKEEQGNKAARAKIAVLEDEQANHPQPKP